MADAQKLVPFILSWEGGYVNDPDDVGGATNKGITIATWRLHGCDNDGDGDIDADDLRIITNEQWMEIFKCQYWDRWKADVGRPRHQTGTKNPRRRGRWHRRPQNTRRT